MSVSIRVKDCSPPPETVYTVPLRIDYAKTEPKAFVRVGERLSSLHMTIGPSKQSQLLKHWQHGQRLPQTLDVSNPSNDGQAFFEVETDETFRAQLNELHSRISLMLADVLDVPHHVAANPLKNASI